MLSWRDGTMPVVSVLCHAYNQAAYASEAIEGILRQRTNFPFEVILRDDASTDGTRELLKGYAARYPRIIRPLFETENGFRKGIKPVSATFPLARGEFVAFCEGDDYWLGTDKLQAQVDLLQRHPDTGAVHGNYLNLIALSGDWRTRVAFRTPEQLRHREGAIYAEMLQANRIQTCTLMCRRSLVVDYRRNGPGVDGYQVGDWPLSLYMSHESRIGFIDKPLAAYRRTPGSITNSGRSAAVARGLDAIRMIGDFCDFFDDHPEVRQAALAAQYRTLLWLAFQAGDREHFDQAWRWLGRNAPKALSASRPRMMHVLIRSAVARCAALALLAATESVKHRIEFHRTGDRSAA